MVFDHLVKHNGVYYRAGEDVPSTYLEELSEEIEPLPSVPAFEDMDDNANTTKPSYTKSALYRMTTEELQTLAANCGIEGAKEKTGTELKKILAERLGQ